MNTRRIAKASEAVRESVSTTILFGIRDPRVKNVTVLRAEVSGDLRSAKVYVSVMGDAKAQSLTMHGLESARGFIQSKVADRLQTQEHPCQLYSIRGVKLSAVTSQALREVMPESVDAVDVDHAGTDDSDFASEMVEDSEMVEVDDDEVESDSTSGSADVR